METSRAEDLSTTSRARNTVKKSVGKPHSFMIKKIIHGENPMLGKSIDSKF